MAGREKPKDPPPKGAPLWIVTFTDMSSLLLTFFILILTFSSMEEVKMNKAEGSLVGGFGVANPNLTPKRDIEPTLTTDQRNRDRNGVTQRHLRTDQVDDIEKSVQRRDLFNVELSRVPEGTRLRLEATGGEEIFELLGGGITDEAKTLLNELGTLVRSMPYRIVIETHVDDRTWRVTRGMTADRWTLDRALAAAEVLESVGIPPERIAASPKGDHAPIEPNADGREARYRNRRLEILLIPDSIDPLYRKFEMKGGDRG